MQPAPPISDYSLIADCHGCALVSRQASIDWCCQPRFDSASCFARLLDPERGGCCRMLLGGAQPHGEACYLDGTLILRTLLRSPEADVQVLDFCPMREDGARHPRLEIARIVECTRGTAEVAIEVLPRFDYGEIHPWIRRARPDAFTAIGGHQGMLIASDGEIEGDRDRVRACRRLPAGERMRLLMRCVSPQRLAFAAPDVPDSAAIDARLQETRSWWRRWSRRLSGSAAAAPALSRSALTLKALTYAPTGAIVAAATTSLPESPGGSRNWDYRFSWIRDSTMSAHALAEVGVEEEARRFRHFIVRSCADRAEELQIVYGIGGERRLNEQELQLDGYRGARPVRIGNRASGQLQLDAYGEILNLAWRWHERGHSPDDEEWVFFAELVEVAAERWREPDCGIWEWRGKPRHFVHSKASCWAALDRGLRLAEASGRHAPVARWRRTREEIREAIETRGYDGNRGCFVQCFDEPQMDAALLLLPIVGFVAFDDERMVRTADAVREELAVNGFLMRYRQDDSLEDREGAFLACSFWLAECYARQGRLTEAQEYFDRAIGVASPQGLLSEEVDPHTRELLGNYPQTLTHLSHIAAAVTIAEAAGLPGPPC